MKVMITGGAGFIGARLARALLARDRLDGTEIDRLVLVDQFPLPEDLAADPRVESRTGPLLTQCAALADETFEGVFHLASAVSAECEADFDLGLRSNLDTTRALIDALRANATHTSRVTKLVFSSSVAVFGPAPPASASSASAIATRYFVDDRTLPAPQTSYGTHKLVCEHLIADYTRKGYLDGRSARLMTVTVRPGKPNGAASSFFSGIIREPLAGMEAICPVSPETSSPLTSVARTVEGLIAVYEAGAAQLGGRLALNLPSVNARVVDMLDALEQVAGREVRERVRFVPDPAVSAIVETWPSGATAERAQRLGLVPDVDFASVIRQYIADCAAQPGGEAALRGMTRP